MWQSNLSPPCKLGVVGATGAMGRAVCAAATAHGFELMLRANRDGWQIDARPDVIVNVSRPGAVSMVVDYCRTHHVALVEGTSALSDSDLQELRQLATTVPVVHAANFTLGHYLQRRALRDIARCMMRVKDRYEYAVYERHPSWKHDGPSASAQALANLWTAVNRHATVATSWLRMGLPVSDHHCLLTLAGESLELIHAVGDREAPAQGALSLALWAARMTPGWWNVDVVYDALIGVTVDG
jgi:4-hydroxy-tetrahydrodipicolinate reductase